MRAYLKGIIRLGLLTFFLFFTGTSSHAFVDQEFPSKEGDRFVKLKNGLTLLIRQDPFSSVTSVQVFVKAGSLYEPPLSGLSHYIEHVVSGGTTSFFSEGEAKKKIEKIGGASNAYTSYNHTVYYINTSNQHWKEALELLLSFVHDCTFEPSEVEREKNVIIEEYKMGENDPSRQLWYLFFSTAYQKHPVKNPVIGKMETFSKYTRDDLVDYYKKRYTPSNMIVAVAGNVKAEDVIEYVSEKTKNWEDKPFLAEVFPAEPLPHRQRIVEKRADFVKQERAMIGFPTVDLFHPDVYALDVLASLLGDGKSSILYRKLKEEKALVSQISSFHWSPSFVRGHLIISLIAVPGKWETLLKELEDITEALKGGQISQEEIELAKKKIISDHVFDKEKISSQARSMALSFLETGDPYFDDEYVEKIKAVSYDDLKDVANKYLSWGRATIALLKPGSKETKVSYEEKGLPSSNKPKLEALSNNLRIFLKRDSRLPVVAIETYGIGGQILDPPEKPGLSYITASLLTAGTNKYSRESIARIIESGGGTIEAGAGRNSYFVSIKILSDHLEEAIDVLSDILTNSVFPQEELEKKKEEILLKMKREEESWEQELFNAFHKNYFLKHLYRFNVLGTENSIKEISREDVIAQYRKMVSPNNTVIAVFGDIDEEKIKNIFQEKLSRWETNENLKMELPEERFPPKGSELITIKTQKTTSSIIVGTGGITIDDRRRAVLDIIDANISGIGYPGGRLHNALRGSKDLVYVVHAFPFYGVKGGYFSVIAQTSPENLKTVKEIILEELKKTYTVPMSEEEIKTSRDIILTMDALSKETLSAQARECAMNEALGLGCNFREKLHEELEKVTPQMVKEVAEELFKNLLIIEAYPEDFTK